MFLREKFIKTTNYERSLYYGRGIEFFTETPLMVCEAPVSMKSKLNFEESIRVCNGITLEQFSKNMEFCNNPFKSENPEVCYC